MQVRLYINDPIAGERVLELPPGGVVIGRALDCTIRTDSAKVSRRHAVITAQDGQWFIVDQNSSHGTKVNDRTISRALLHDGDVIRCGDMEIRFAPQPAKEEGTRTLPAEPAAPSQVGAYTVLGLLGSGGMGAVYLGENKMLGRRAAIKLLHTEFSRHEEWSRRLFNEARAVNIIRHPGIVDISELGRLSDDRLFIVMEYLEGQTLAQRIAKLGKLAVPRALSFAQQIASALSAAHAKGIVHRVLSCA